jgi:hypothetical protein
VGVAAVVLVPAFVLFIGAWLRWGMKCDESCSDTPNRAYEPGHAWTSYTTSWQWDAQFALAAGGLVAAAATGWLTAKGRGTQATVAVLTAVLLSGGWCIWYSASPPLGS